jgi:hypothetical protein
MSANAELSKTLRHNNWNGIKSTAYEAIEDVCPDLKTLTATLLLEVLLFFARGLINSSTNWISKIPAAARA